jgi:hypothetical protein
MNTHPYLRAYLAGIFVPTFVLPLLLTVFIVARIVLKVPVPIEQAMIFPMAVVPMLFGLWNMLYLCSHAHTHLPIGLHGAILPLLMMPTGAFVGIYLGVLSLGSSGVTWFHACEVPYAYFAIFLLAGMAVYYLVWKYIVGFLNRVLGIA